MAVIYVREGKLQTNSFSPPKKSSRLSRDESHYDRKCTDRLSLLFAAFPIIAFLLAFFMSAFAVLAFILAFFFAFVRTFFAGALFFYLVLSKRLGYGGSGQHGCQCQEHELFHC
jgi:hypothetical protein